MAPPSPPSPALTLTRPVVLVGMMGAGKSSAGRKLAERLGVSFRDCDWEIEQNVGMPISHYFSAYGEAAFRAKEGEILAGLLDMQPPGVIASGGGTFIQTSCRELIRARAVSVFLKAGLETLAGRILGPAVSTRPLLAGANDPKATLARLLEDRTPVYAQADAVLMVDGLRPDAVVDGLIRAIRPLMEPS